ncbi:hypothetical protein [Streptomyces blastmyceticus]|uniref:Resolvase/invertase-type recombinase catalytic domain-containing protein n=1 Tax=Streptomyces blastmyceticus TaxID=68180 RepID=A0ABP3HBT1_9ACTN
MVSNQRAAPQEPPAARRSEGDRQRRRRLADAASGLVQKIERFRCVIYLSGIHGADTDQHRQECQETAEILGWDVVAVVVEKGSQHSAPPREREGMESALSRLRCGEAGAILTAWRSMISPSVDEYRETVREIEETGGFVYAKRLVSPEETDEAAP